MARADAGSSGAVAQTLPDDLKIVWETKTAEAIETTPVSDRERVYVTDVMGGLEALDLQTGKSVWRREFETGFAASPGLYLPESIDPKAASFISPIAQIPVPGDANQTAAPEVLKIPLLVVGDVEGNVYGLNPDHGESLWTFATDGEVTGAPAFFAVLSTNQSEPANSRVTEIRVLQTSQDGSLYCLNAHTGELVWKYETGDQIRCAASIGDGKTFIGGCDGALHVVDLATGEPSREALPLGGPTGSTPAIVNNDVYLPIMDGVVFAFDLQSSDVRWKFEDPDRLQEYRSSVAVGPDRIIVSSNNKHVDAIDRKSGERIWRKTLRRRADASPLIAGEDVWIASSDGLLSRFALADGETKWSFESRGKFLAAPAIIGDRLLIADDNGLVRCFAASSNAAPAAVQ